MVSHSRLPCRRRSRRNSSRSGHHRRDAAPHGQTRSCSRSRRSSTSRSSGGCSSISSRRHSRRISPHARTHIRQDLVTASELRATASAQLAEIDRKLKALPAELEALQAQGAEDVKAEQARIAQAAAAERERLIAQTRREIETRLRMARRQLTEHAAALAVRDRRGAHQAVDYTGGSAPSRGSLCGAVEGGAMTSRSAANPLCARALRRREQREADVEQAGRDLRRSPNWSRITSRSRRSLPTPRSPRRRRKPWSSS